MTAYAGFYVTPEAWTDWVRSNPKCPTWEWGVTVAQDMIEDALDEKKIGDYFGVEIVPVPPSDPGYTEDPRALMLVRRTEPRRAYIAQRLDSRCDLYGRRLIKYLLGLEASEWRTMWYNEMSCTPPYETEFLKPGAPMGGAKGKAKTRRKTKTESEPRNSTDSKQVLGDQDRKDKVETRDAGVMTEDRGDENKP
ncbi:unnamed protein product [Rhizoctonia solani]|uniref:Uncharacterized protein n=1 Tax=Rhizoctonia solani TaxID=456999 RepID=A0A8H3DKP5_9AGAM|nr:unnamed protein product [Rhizoctonia solani]